MELQAVHWAQSLTQQTIMVSNLIEHLSLLEFMDGYLLTCSPGGEHRAGLVYVETNCWLARGYGFDTGLLP
jgi:hypothetical protein